jgi:hypothetical protein
LNRDVFSGWNVRVADVKERDARYRDENDKDKKGQYKFDK